MPSLDSDIHSHMLRDGREARRLRARLRAAARALFSKPPPYGLEWGDPDHVEPLVYVREHFLEPYLSPNGTVVEIGPGGGRWTRYMLVARRIYAVDYHQELLDELRKTINRPNVTFVKNHGSDFPDVPDHSIDFIFSFGCFVHLDQDIIAHYLANMRRLLLPRSNVVLQYSDKTKPLARASPGFSDNDPETMRALVLAEGYEIREEDTATLWHSGIVRIGLAPS
jgi:SAM-dependent methyltransferase